MKSAQIANLVIFLATAATGVALILTNHERIGEGALLIAFGHAAGPSPFIRTGWEKSGASTEGGEA